jgi:hypothetical protein
MVQLPEGRVVPLHAGLDDGRPSARGGALDPERLLAGQGQRLLAQDVPNAARQARLDLLPVLVGPGAEDDAVERDLVEHGPEVGEGGAGPVLGGPGSRALRVEVAAGRQLQAWDGRRRPGVDVRVRAAAGHAEANQRLSLHRTLHGAELEPSRLGRQDRAARGRW